MFLNQDAKKEKAILNKINFVRNQDRCIYSFAVFVFIIFLIPNDVLTNYPFLQSFTDLMAGIVPGIDVLASASKLNEALRLYLSLLWVVGMGCFIYIVYGYLQLMYYLKYTDIFSKDEIELIKEINTMKDKNPWTMIITAIVICFLIYYFVVIPFTTGNIIEANTRVLDTQKLIHSKIGIVWFSTITSGVTFLGLPLYIAANIYHLIFRNYNEGENYVTDK